MDRIINVKVGGNHLSKDNKNAGVRGEGNVTLLRITFDEGWDGYAKTVTFFDAHGNNPVKRVETVDLIEDIENDARTYLTPIPPEAMTVAGELTFVIDGYLDGKRQRSFADTLVVKDAPIADNAGEPTDATPTEPEQWQTQIDTMMGTIQEAFVAKGEAVQARDEAVTAKDVSEANAKDAKFMADRAEGLSVAAQGSVLEAEEYAKKAEENAKKAEDTLGKTNYIGDNGNWYAWDSSIGAFYDTGVKAQSGSTVYLGDNPPADADVWIDLDGEEDTTQDIDAHMSNTDIHTTAEEKLVASEAYDLAREAKGIAISADSVAEKSLQYWQPNTTYRAGQAVYVTTYSGDYIYKCIVGHTSGDTFSETIDSVKVWQFIREVTAEFAVRADVAVRAEYDVDGDGIAKAAYLDLKADKPVITTSVDTVLSFEFSANHNTETRLSELTTLSFTFGNGEYAEDYASGLSFDSGETPTAIDYTDSGILNWVGTDCVTSDGLSIFQPSANTHYDIVFYFNGKQFIGLVNGYVPATGNEAI